MHNASRLELENAHKKFKEMKNCIKSMNDDVELDIVSSVPMQKPKVARVRSNLIDDMHVNYDSPRRNLTPQRSMIRQSISTSRIVNRNNEVLYQETEESIIELPIQLKISGKIEKR
jgi:hypothetical protein